MNPADSVITAFQQMHQEWFSILWNFANGLFLSLVAIELVVVALGRISHGRGVESFIPSLVWRTLVVGFWYSVLFYSDLWLGAVFAGFMQAGQAAAHVSQLSPGEVFFQGLAIGAKMIASFRAWSWFSDPAGIIAGMVAALLVIFSYLVIAVTVGITLVKSYILLGGGVIMLGFSGWHGSAHLSERYIWTCVGVGVQLLMLYLIIGAGSVLAVQWAELINETSALDIRVPFLVVGGAVMYAAVAMSVPALAGSLASGGGGMGFGAVVGATAAAGRMTGAAVTGGAMAASTAGLAISNAGAAGGGIKGAALGGMRALGTAGTALAGASVPRMARAAETIARKK